jgi:hypothetical protein
VVVCQLFDSGINWPKLFVRVPRGYPRAGSCTFWFENCALGSDGLTRGVQSHFVDKISSASANFIGVFGILDAWASVVQAAIAE